MPNIIATNDHIIYSDLRIFHARMAAFKAAVKPAQSTQNHD